jgi:two-component system nitrogen regulation response regulator NtrX
MLDVRLADGSGIELLRWMRSNAIESPILMISGHGTIADAVEATRAGAFDFLEKPLSRDKVLLSLKHALEQTKLREENRQLREIAGSPRMIGPARRSRGCWNKPPWPHAATPRPAHRGIGHGKGTARRAHTCGKSLRAGARSSK